MLGYTWYFVLWRLIFSAILCSFFYLTLYAKCLCNLLHVTRLAPRIYQWLQCLENLLTSVCYRWGNFINQMICHGLERDSTELVRAWICSIAFDFSSGFLFLR
jgi:hypothetical protein